MSLISQSNPGEAEKGIKLAAFGATIDTIVDQLWEQCKVSYFGNPPMYTAALLVGGVCAEAAHRFHCKSKGVSRSLLKGDWDTLINYSISNQLLPHSSVGKILHLIRQDYRNPWIHVDLDKISKTVPKTTMDMSLTALIFSQQLALDCLWLTSVELSALYGSTPPLFEPSIR
jgi:hypothetical protein